MIGISGYVIVEDHIFIVLKLNVIERLVSNVCIYDLDARENILPADEMVDCRS